MSLDFIKLHRERENFLVDSTAPVYIPGGPVSANDMACLAAWFEIADSSAGLGGAPGTATVEYSPDDGTTWVTVPGMVGGSITGNGVDFNLQSTSATGIFPPLIRFKFVAPAGQYYRVVHIRRNHVTPGFVASLRSSSSAVNGFGDSSLGARVAAQLGAPVVLPVPSAVSYKDITSSPFTKVAANDGRALDINIASAIGLTSQFQINYNSSLTTPTYSTATPANNKGLPVIFTAGDALAPVAMGSGADSALTLRTTLSTRHEAVTTPVSIRISDSTEFLTANETYALNTQFVKAAQTLRLPVSAAMIGWDFTNNTRKEVRTDTNGDLQAKVMNFPTGFNSTIIGPFGQALMAASLPVVLSSDHSSLPVTVGNFPAAATSTPAVHRSLGHAPYTRDYSSSNIALGASVFTELIASTSAQVTKIHVFDSNGRAWYLCFGAAGSEVRQIIIPPGGDTFELLIPVGTRLSANVVDALVINSGLLHISLLS
jgi:hypothetical protein